MNPPTVRLAFIGTGGWAHKYHFPALAYLAAQDPATIGVRLSLRGIYSLEPDLARAVAAETGFQQVYPDLDALIDDKVDALALAITPTALPDVLPRLVAKGVPILSEKPPGESTAAAQALSDLVTVPNVMAFNRRFSPLNNTFKRLIDELNGIYYVEGDFYRYRRTDETFMVGTGIHWINFMEYLFGSIEQVRTTTFASPSNETLNRIGDLTFAGALRGRLNVFQFNGAQLERVTVHSSDRTIVLHGPLWQDPGHITIHQGPDVTVIDPESDHPLPEIERLGIVGEYLELLTKACRGLPTRSTFQNAVNSMRVAEAMECAAPSHE